jgi:hypothetical protein
MRLPKEMQYVGYTTKVVRSYGATSNISSITTGARNIGTIPVNGTAFVFFQATVPSSAKPLSKHVTRVKLDYETLPMSAATKLLQKMTTQMFRHVNLKKPLKLLTLQL